MTLSQRLREEVSNKLKIKSRQLRNRIKEFAVERKIADRDVALLILAYEQHIDVRKPRYQVRQDKLDKFEEELKSQRAIPSFPIIPAAQIKRKGAKPSSIQTVIEFNKGMKITDPLLPKKLVEEATQMASVYPVVYIFENSVRNLVSNVLSKKHEQNWWDTKVGSKVKDKVRDRIEKEEKNRWHGRRGAHPIFYTDIDDLKSIIAANWSDFKEIFPNFQWVAGKIDEIEMSRNVIAHNNPLEERDITRLKLNLEDWIMQISRWTEKVVYPVATEKKQNVATRP